MVQSRRTGSAVSLSSKKRAHILLAEASRWLMLLSVLNGAEMNGDAMSYLFYSVCPLDIILMCAVNVPPRTICAD